MKRLSNSTTRLQDQEMFQILAKANELESKGKHIIHFELGDPDFDTSKKVYVLHGLNQKNLNKKLFFCL